jgi:hypothetical protein
MRAKEFTINVPISIKINGDEEPVVSAGDQSEPELQQNPVMVPPLQQAIELAKSAQGKESPVIDKLTQSDDVGGKTQQQDDSLLHAIKRLISR